MKFGLTLLGMGMTFWLGGFLTLIFTMATSGPVPNLLLGVWAGAAILFMVAGLVVVGLHLAAKSRDLWR